MKEIDGNAGVPEMPEEAGEPVWKSVIEAPGFAEAWERARGQARRGEEVPPEVVRGLWDEVREAGVTVDDLLVVKGQFERGETIPWSEVRRSLQEEKDDSLES